MKRLLQLLYHKSAERLDNRSFEIFINCAQMACQIYKAWKLYFVLEGSTACNKVDELIFHTAGAADCFATRLYTARLSRKICAISATVM